MRTDFDKWWEDYYDCVFDGVGHAASQHEAAQAAWQAAQQKWRPIETAPKGQRILVVTEKRVPFFAKYILPRTHEANSDSALDWAEWDEMSDTPWCTEGWYMEVDCELCEVDYRQYAGMPLTQWMPVPGVPE